MLLDRRTGLGLLIVAERSQELSCILQFNLVRQCYFMPTEKRILKKAEEVEISKFFFFLKRRLVLIFPLPWK
ncbi:unnamed protein product [Musa acuminata subsp. malaccensis]|uniref:(wild Malaysian banana) hypothetical protein n=1 Tax=Musa acuminata subsp. malaccensis TaxID=214687 RepID=A0A804HPB6_MUSAM|nr:unnamed protein product [Musa acuminata subsp. malaccensis]